MNIKKIIFLALLLSTSAFASNAGEIYTWGYFDFVKESLLALSGVIAGGNDYLLKIVVALAMTIFLIRQSTNPRTGAMLGFEVVKLLTVIVLVKQLFLVAPDDNKHKYVVVDKITLQTEEIHQIPKGIGELLSLFTRLEDAIMEKMDMHFSLPNSLSYRNSGLGFSLTSQSEILRQDIKDGYVQKTFFEYFENCKMLGDFSDGTQDISELINAEGDAVETVLSTEQTLLTIEYTKANPEGTVNECKTVWEHLKDSISNISDSTVETLAKTHGITKTLYSEKSALAREVILGTAKSANDQIKNAIWRNSSLDAVKTTSIKIGMPQNQLIKMKSVAEVSMANDAALSNLEAQGTIPLLKAIVLSFLIAISWILAILSIATLNPIYIRLLITLNIWLLLWGPLFTVLNYAIDILVQDAASAYGGMMAVNSQIGIYTLLGAKLSMMSKLVWAIPMLAFAIAKGSDHAMVSFIGSAGSGVQQSVSAESRSATNDGVSGKAVFTDIGEQIASRFDGGGMHNVSTSNGKYGVHNSELTSNKNGTVVSTEGVGGRNIVQDGGNGIGVSVSGTVSSSTTRNYQKAMEDARQSMQSMAKTLSSTDGETIQKGLASLRSSTEGKTKLSNAGFTESDTKNIQEAETQTKRDTLSHTMGKGRAITVSDNQGNSREVKFTASASAHLGFDLVDSIGAKVGVSYDVSNNGTISIQKSDGTSEEWHMSKEDQESFEKQYQMSLQHTLQSSSAYSQSWQKGVSVTRGDSASETKSHVEQVQQTWGNSENMTKLYREASSYSQSISSNTVSALFRKELTTELADKYLDDSGHFKNDAAQKAYSEYVQNKLDYWNQGGASALDDFANFQNDYGGGVPLVNPVDKTGVQAGNLNSPTNMQVSTINKEKVLGEVNSPSHLSGVDEHIASGQNSANKGQAVTNEAKNLHTPKNNVHDPKVKATVDFKTHSFSTEGTVVVDMNHKGTNFNTLNGHIEKGEGSSMGHPNGSGRTPGDPRFRSRRNNLKID